MNEPNYKEMWEKMKSDAEAERLEIIELLEESDSCYVDLEGDEIEAKKILYEYYGFVLDLMREYEAKYLPQRRPIK